MTEVLYRYIDSYPEYEGEPSNIYCRQYAIRKRTEKGVWIMVAYQKKFVLNKAKKKFAYPTKEEAFKSFAIRKNHHMGHVKFTFAHLTNILTLIKKREDEEITKKTEEFVSAMAEMQ